MELLDIVDENGIPTGCTVKRELAHKDGVLHRTAHVWLFRKINGVVQILLQKRSADKDSYPGCYDISSAGHIPAGQDYISSAIRELKEELGMVADPDHLIYCGTRHIAMDTVFYGKEFHDRQVSRVYALESQLSETDFVLQKEEVESVCWMDYDECMQKVQNGTINSCIYLEELEMLKNAFQAKRA